MSSIKHKMISFCPVLANTHDLLYWLWGGEKKKITKVMNRIVFWANIAIVEASEPRHSRQDARPALPLTHRQVPLADTSTQWWDWKQTPVLKKSQICPNKNLYECLTDDSLQVQYILFVKRKVNKSKTRSFVLAWLLVIPYYLMDLQHGLCHIFFSWNQLLTMFSDTVLS